LQLSGQVFFSLYQSLSPTFSACHFMTNLFCKDVVSTYTFQMWKTALHSILKWT
jgi:hypothetical protein